MKISIANLLLCVTVIAIAIAWRIDRAQLAQKYENATSTTVAAFRANRNCRFFASCYDPDIMVKESELYEFMDQHDESAERFLSLMAVYRLRDSISSESLVNIFAQHSMKDLGCETIDDLRQLINDAEWKWDIVLDSKSPDGKEFEKFVADAMKPLY